MAVSVLNYLRINRVDQAEKTVKAMSAIDDDSTVTQLATAWVGVFLVRPPPPPRGVTGWRVPASPTPTFIFTFPARTEGIRRSACVCGARRKTRLGFVVRRAARRRGCTGALLKYTNYERLLEGTFACLVRHAAVRYCCAASRRCAVRALAGGARQLSLCGGEPQGGSKVQDASYIYQELGDKYNWTVRKNRLLMQLAACGRSDCCTLVGGRTT